MIDILSDRLTCMIKKNTGEMDSDREEVINYGINILIYEILMCSIVIIISIIFGVLLEALILLTINGLLRKIAGGAHAHTRIVCASSSLIIVFGSIIISKILWAESFYPALILFLIELIIIYKYAPGDTEEKPIASKKQRKRLKMFTYISVTVIFAAAIVIWYFNKEFYNLMILLTIPTMFLLTPTGYKLVGCSHSKL